MTGRGQDDGLGGAGLIGAGIAVAVCCLAPLMLVLVGTAAISAWLSWLGYGGLAIVVLALGLLAYGLWRQRGRSGPAAGSADEKVGGRS